MLFEHQGAEEVIKQWESCFFYFSSQLSLLLTDPALFLLQCMEASVCMCVCFSEWERESHTTEKTTLIWSLIWTTHYFINKIENIFSSMQVYRLLLSLCTYFAVVIVFVTPSIIYVTVYLNKSRLCSEKCKKLTNGMKAKQISIDLFWLH